MEKSKIEEALELRAKNRVDEDINNFVKLILANPIGNLLEVKIIVDGQEQKVPVANFGVNYGLVNNKDTFHDSYNGHKENKNSKEYTNLEAVKRELLERYIQEETEELLNKVESIGYLFN